MNWTEEEWKLLKEVLRALTFGIDAASPLRELVESVDKRLENNSQHQPIPVYWMGSDGNIRREYAVRVVDAVEGPRVEFADGEWNPLDQCFLTEEQCRDHDKKHSIKKKLQDVMYEL